MAQRPGMRGAPGAGALRVLLLDRVEIGVHQRLRVHDQGALAREIGEENLAAVARPRGLGTRERKAMTFEVGIRNAGLGLGLIFTFFGGLGGMAIVAGWWGVWDIIAGLVVAALWARHTKRRTGSAKGDASRRAMAAAARAAAA